MTTLSRPNLYLALTHYPVINKQGVQIASAVTNLDLHDLARLARTYGLKRFYVITPLSDQQRLVSQIVDHWVSGAGATYNPARHHALSMISVHDCLADACRDASRIEGDDGVQIVATSARRLAGAMSFQRMRERLQTAPPLMLVLGTAWGLADTVIDAADYVLEPVIGCTDYNHLSVRAAAAIILDRLLGMRS